MPHAEIFASSLRDGAVQVEMSARGARISDVAKRPMTMFAYCVREAGPLKGAQVAAFIAQWAIASNAAGRPITRDDYMAYWCVSRPTAYRELQRFNAIPAFAHMKTPQMVADYAIRCGEQWMARGVSGFRDLPVAGLLST